MMSIRQRLTSCVASALSLALVITSTSGAAFSSAPVFSIELPRDLGTVVESNLSSAGVMPKDMIVLVQDLHLHYSTQKRIAKILSYLYDKQLVAGPVAVEGVQGAYDTSRLASYPKGEIKNKLVDYFMKKGELSGDEAFSILRQDGNILQGVDNSSYYELNKTLFKTTAEHRAQLIRQLDRQEPDSMESALALLDQKLAVSPNSDIRQLLQADHITSLTDRLLHQEVTRDQARYLAQHLPAVVETLSQLTGHQDTTALEETLRSAIDFYIVAQMRDKPLAENTLALLKSQVEINGRRAIACVAGGYHTKALVQAFQAAGVAYAVIMPNVTELPTAEERQLYEKRLMGERLTELEVARDFNGTIPAQEESLSNVTSDEETVAVRSSLFSEAGGRIWSLAAYYAARRRGLSIADSIKHVVSIFNQEKQSAKLNFINAARAYTQEVQLRQDPRFDALHHTAENPQKWWQSLARKFAAWLAKHWAWTHLAWDVLMPESVKLMLPEHLSSIQFSYDDTSAIVPLSESPETYIQRYTQEKIELTDYDRRMIDEMVRDYDYRSRGDAGKPAPSPRVWFLWGVTWAQLAKEKAAVAGIDNRKVVLARDTRQVEPELFEALVAGLTYAGLDVVYVGTEPDSASTYATSLMEIQPLMGIFITSSHVTSPDDVMIRGAKVSILEKAPNDMLEMASLTTNEIKKTTHGILQSYLGDPANLERERATQPGKLQSYDPLDMNRRWNALVGRIVALNSPSLSLYQLKEATNNMYRLKPEERLYGRFEALVTDWEKKLAQVVEAQPGNQEGYYPLRGLKVTIEGANTPSGQLAVKSFESLGAETDLINGGIKALKGKHTADPSKIENLEGLKERMRKTGSKIGLAFDLDGDRVAIVLMTDDGEFISLPPDNLMEALLPFLANQGGFNPGTTHQKFVVIRDVLSTKAVDDVAENLGIQSYQTDSGYVFLKARARQLKAEGSKVIMMGERSGHGWLMGEFENPIELAILYAVMGHQHGAQSHQTFPMVDIFNRNTIPVQQSERFAPPFHDNFLEKLGGQFGAESNWQYAPGKVPNQKIIAYGRNEAINAALSEFVVGNKFSTQAGEIQVKSISTESEEERSGDGLHRFVDIEFADASGNYIGRFVLRASANDPTFVASYESPKRHDDQDLLRYQAIGGVVLDFLEGQNMANVVGSMVLDKNTIKESESLLAYRAWQSEKNSSAPHYTSRTGRPSISLRFSGSTVELAVIWPGEFNPVKVKFNWTQVAEKLGYTREQLSENGREAEVQEKTILFIATEYAKLFNNQGISLQQINEFALSVAGQVHGENVELTNVPGNFVGVPLGDLILKKLAEVTASSDPGIKVMTRNDTVASWVGESRHREGQIRRDRRQDIYATLGTGLGGYRPAWWQWFRFRRVPALKELGQSLMFNLSTNSWELISFKKLNRNHRKEGQYIAPTDGRVFAEHMLAGTWTGIRFVKTLDPSQRQVLATKTKVDPDRIEAMYNAKMGEIMLWSKQFTESEMGGINSFIGSAKEGTAESVEQAAYDHRQEFFHDFAMANRALLRHPNFRYTHFYTWFFATLRSYLRKHLPESTVNDPRLASFWEGLRKLALGSRIVWGGGLILGWASNDPKYNEAIKLAIDDDAIGEVLLSKVPDNEHAAAMKTQPASMGSYGMLGLLALAPHPAKLTEHVSQFHWTMPEMVSPILLAVSVVLVLAIVGGRTYRARQDALRRAEASGSELFSKIQRINFDAFRTAAVQLGVASLAFFVALKASMAFGAQQEAANSFAAASAVFTAA